MRIHKRAALIFFLSWLLIGICSCQEPTAVPHQSTVETQISSSTGGIELHYPKSIKPGEVLNVQATNTSLLPIYFLLPYSADYCLHVFRAGQLVRHLPEMACDTFASILVEPGMTRYLLAWDGMICDGDDPACEQRRPAPPGTYTFDIAYEVSSSEVEPSLPGHVEGIFVVIP